MNTTQFYPTGRQELAFLNPYTGETTEFEKEVQDLVQTEAKTFDTQGRKAFHRRISLIAGGILFRIREMKRNGLSPTLIADAQKAALQQLKISSNEFRTEVQRYEEKKEEVINSLSEITSFIDSTSLDFEELVPPERPKPLFADFRRLRMEQHMATVRVAAVAIQGAETLIGEGIKLTVLGMKKFCELNNPLYQLMWDSMTEAAQTGFQLSAVLFQKIGVAKVAKDIAEFMAQEPTAFVQELEKMGIPKEQSMQFHHDTMHVAPYFIPFGAIGKIVKFPGKAFSKATKLIQESTELAPKKIPLHTDTYSRQLREKLHALDELLYKGKSPTTLAEAFESTGSLFEAVKDSCGVLEKLLPDFSQTGLTEKEMWISVAKKIYPTFSESPTVQFLKKNPKEMLTHLGGGHYITMIKEGAYKETISKLSDPHYSVLIKEADDIHTIFWELFGLDQKHSWALQKLHIPPPLAVGSFRAGEETRFFIMKSSIPGQNFAETLQQIGTLRSSERKILLSEFTLANQKLGEAFGEFHTKGLFNELSYNMHLHTLNELIASTEHYLKNSIITEILGESRKLGTIIQELEKNPGGRSFGFFETTPSHYTWWKKHDVSVGSVDSEFIFDTHIKRGKTEACQKEVVDFLIEMESKGKQFGLTPREITTLEEAFLTGYKSEFKGPSSQAVEDFYTIYRQVDRINKLAQVENLDNSGLRLLREMIDELKRSLK